MNNLQVFSNEEFGDIRGIEINGEPWFVGRDIAEVLKYKDLSHAIMDNVDEDDRRTIKSSEIQNGSNAPFGIPNRGLIFINESGLYSLIMSSKLPKAKQFKHWVTSEVLPSIRKHGGYIYGQEEMDTEELLSRALLVAQSKIEERERIIQKQQEKIEEDAPKVAFADAVYDADGLTSVGTLAKTLVQLGKNTGEKRLFEELRQDGFLMKQDRDYPNIPTQKSVNLGLFKIVYKVVFDHYNEQSRRLAVPKLTEKGFKYLINYFIEKDNLGKDWEAYC